jgi:hypothetical protein
VAGVLVMLELVVEQTSLEKKNSSSASDKIVIFGRRRHFIQR